MIHEVIEIPPSRLSEDLLQAIIEEFVSRDGTDYGERECGLEEKVRGVREQLKRNEVLIQYDQRTESVNIVKK